MERIRCIAVSHKASHRPYYSYSHGRYGYGHYSKLYAYSDNIWLNQGESKQFRLRAHSNRVKNLHFSVVNYPRHGVIKGTNNNLTYIPNQDYDGRDALKFRVSDGRHSKFAWIYLRIKPAPVNTAPIAERQVLSTDASSALAILLNGTDKDGDRLSYSIVTQPSSGVLSGELPALSYLQAAGFTGVDSFSFVVNDGSLSSQPAAVKIRVNVEHHFTIV